MRYFFCELHFKNLKQRFEAFKILGAQTNAVGVSNSFSFYKALGTGSGNGFNALPNFGKYAFVLGLNDPVTCEEALQILPYSDATRESSTDVLATRIEPVKVSGSWDGRNPFMDQAPGLESLEPLMVLTRAAIRPFKIFDFWMNVKGVARHMKNARGVWFQSGVGEYPLFMQATVSIWKNTEHLREAAYKSGAHKKAVEKTRSRDWYSEDMFAQFRIAEYYTKGKQYGTLASELTQAGIQGSQN